jgi:hypothetical protein
MPKEDIDYSNTIIYKIYCNDKSINDVYVSHTTNFTKRKYLHKSACSNLNNNLKIYNTIRQNGGWDNWNMVEIAKYNCKDKTEARIKEQHHYEDLNATLNISPHFQEIKYIFCENCNYKCSKQSEYNKHILTNKHLILQNPTYKSPKISAQFLCELCDYKCCKQSEYNKHILTNKHQILQNPTSNPTSKISDKKYPCICGKIYKHSSTLYAHKKKCNQQINTDIESNKIIHDNSVDKDELILMLIKQNSELIKETSEFKNIMMEVIKNGTNNNTVNSHNKSFNLNFFLNETCKDAMNIMDFVDSIKLQLSDLENVGKLGFVEGISNIIVKNLNSLDENKRPVHCTDSKREVMYVKDENKWEKENNDNLKMRKAVKNVAYKNSKMLSEFRTKHPDCLKSSSKVSDKYNKLVFEAFGGKGDNDSEKEDKIIKNIAKEVTIDK